jgi:signal transduction histidine kinase
MPDHTTTDAGRAADDRLRTIQATLSHREKELAAARRISEALSQRIKLQDLIEEALRTTLDVLDAENGSLLLADSDSEQLVFYHSIGDKPAPQGAAIPWKEGIAGSVFQSRKPEIVLDAQTDARHFADIDQACGSVTRDMITIPLKKWEGDPIGVIQIMNKRHGTLNEEDVGILTIMSALSATAIEQARLFEHTKLAEVAQMMGDITHDIKNLLMPVVCGAGILQVEINELLERLPHIEMERAKASRELCNEVIEMLKDDARRIQDRVKEIADCVKGLTTPLEFAPCQIADVVGNVYKTLGIMAQEKQVALKTERLEPLPPIVADERRLYNAFYNLVNNAIPEVPPGGSVTVSAVHDSNAASITVSVIDTGKGMRPEIRDRLFTPRTISSKPGGTGLGTKIVRDVVTAHGGTIAVESELGRGSAFHLTFPLRPRDNPPK